MNEPDSVLEAKQTRMCRNHQLIHSGSGKCATHHDGCYIVPPIEANTSHCKHMQMYLFKGIYRQQVVYIEQSISPDKVSAVKAIRIRYIGYGLVGFKFGLNKAEAAVVHGYVQPDSIVYQPENGELNPRHLNVLICARYNYIQKWRWEQNEFITFENKFTQR